MNRMIIEDIVTENEKQGVAVRAQEHIPHVMTVDTVSADNVESLQPKRGRGRPKIAPEMRKRTNGRFYVKLYLSYPSADQVARLRNMAKAFNKTNEMRFARLLKIANSPSEAAQMVVAIGEEKAEIERKYRVWLRQKTRRDKEIEEKTFRQTVRALSKAIKNSRPAADK